MRPIREADIQRTAADYLQIVAPWGRGRFLWHSIPNEGRRGKAATGRLKGAGMRPGVADLTFIKAADVRTSPTVAFIELKTAKGRQTRQQREFQKDCERLGRAYAICRSPEQVEAQLRRWAFVTASDPSIGG